MRIAIFTDTFLPKIDGITISIRNVLNILSKDHQFRVFAPDYRENGLKAKFHRNVAIERIPAVSLPSYKDVKIAFPSMKNVLASLCEFKPDIIHIHTPGAIGMAGVRCAKKLGVKSVGTYHTLVSQETMYISPVKILKLDKLAAMFENIFSMKKSPEAMLKKAEKAKKKALEDNLAKRIAWNLSKKLYDQCNLIIVPSAAIKRELKKQKFKTPIEVISNGIDLSLFKPKKNYKADGVKLIHVGRISFEKNVEIVIRSLLILRKRVANATLSIVGEGPALNKAKSLVHNLGLDKQVKFYGYVAHKDLGKIYREHDVFLTASTMETQGLVVLEAMACGLPVVAANKYALPDLVGKENGFLVKPFHENDMADAVEKLALSQKLRERLGKNSARIAATHGIKDCIRILEKTYSKL